MGHFKGYQPVGWLNEFSVIWISRLKCIYAEILFLFFFKFQRQVCREWFCHRGQTQQPKVFHSAVPWRRYLFRNNSWRHHTRSYPAERVFRCCWVNIPVHFPHWWQIKIEWINFKSPVDVLREASMDALTLNEISENKLGETSYLITARTKSISTSVRFFIVAESSESERDVRQRSDGRLFWNGPRLWVATGHARSVDPIGMKHRFRWCRNISRCQPTSSRLEVNVIWLLSNQLLVSGHSFSKGAGLQKHVAYAWTAPNGHYSLIAQIWGKFSPCQIAEQLLKVKNRIRNVLVFPPIGWFPWKTQSA